MSCSIQNLVSGTTGAASISAGAPAPWPADGLQTRAAAEPAGEQHNSCVPLKITGDLTIAAATVQQAILAGFISQGPDLALDLSEVHECDTAGLQLIYSLRRTVLRRKERLQIVAVSPEIQELAAALGLRIQELRNVRGSVVTDADSSSRSDTDGL
jgi:anti-anti-sigma factor